MTDHVKKFVKDANQWLHIYNAEIEALHPSNMPHLNGEEMCDEYHDKLEEFDEMVIIHYNELHYLVEEFLKTQNKN